MTKKISYANLKLKLNTNTKSVAVGDTEIEVLEYLPIEEKYSLIMTVLAGSKEDTGLYNQLKLNMLFNLYLIYAYTNINFTDKQKEDEIKLYDILESNGVVDTVIAAIDEKEYNELQGYITKTIEDDIKYNTTIAGTLKSIIAELPKQAEEVKKILDNFDKEKFQNVIDFAQAANGGRPIN